MAKHPKAKSAAHDGPHEPETEPHAPDEGEKMDPMAAPAADGASDAPMPLPDNAPAEPPMSAPEMPQEAVSAPAGMVKRKVWRHGALLLDGMRYPPGCELEVPSGFEHPSLEPMTGKPNG